MPTLNTIKHLPVTLLYSTDVNTLLNMALEPGVYYAIKYDNVYSFEMERFIQAIRETLSFVTLSSPPSRQNCGKLNLPDYFAFDFGEVLWTNEERKFLQDKGINPIIYAYSDSTKEGLYLWGSYFIDSGKKPHHIFYNNHIDTEFDRLLEEDRVLPIEKEIGKYIETLNGELVDIHLLTCIKNTVLSMLDDWYDGYGGSVLCDMTNNTPDTMDLKSIMLDYQVGNREYHLKFDWSSHQSLSQQNITDTHPVKSECMPVVYTGFNGLLDRNSNVVVGIDENLTPYGTYGGQFDDTYWIRADMPIDESLKLADHMIDLWQRYRQGRLHKGTLVDIDIILSPPSDLNEDSNVYQIQVIGTYDGNHKFYLHLPSDIILTTSDDSLVTIDSDGVLTTHPVRDIETVTVKAEHKIHKGIYDEVNLVLYPNGTQLLIG